MSNNPLYAAKPTLTPKCPEFGKVLKKTTFRLEIDGASHQIIRLSPTPAAWFMRVAVNSIKVTSFAFIFLLAVYLPDYIFDYANRGQKFGAFLGVYLLIALAFVILCGLIRVILTPRSCCIDITGQKIVFAKRITPEKYKKSAISFNDIECVEIMPTSSFFETNKVAILIHGNYHFMAESKQMSNELSELVDWFQSILPENR